MEGQNVAEILKDRGISFNINKTAPATQSVTEKAVEAKPEVVSDEDSSRLNSAFESSSNKTLNTEPEKSEEVVAKSPDAIDLSKEPEAAESIQDREKVIKKVVDKINKDKKSIENEKEKKPEEVNEEKAATIEKNWWENEPVDTKENKVSDTKEAVSDDTKAKLAEYESLINDPETAAFLAAKKSGKNLFDFIEEVKPIDYSKMTPENLFELKLKRLGITDEDLKDAMDDFSALPKWKQKEEYMSLKATFESEQSERLKKFSQEASRQMEAQANFIKKAELNLDKKLDSIVDTEFYGLKITNAEKEVLRNAVVNEIAVRDKVTGEIDIERSLELALWDKFKKEVVRANVTKAKASKSEEYFKERVRPTAKVIETVRQPIISDKEKLAEAKEAYIKKQLGNQGN